MNKPCIAVIGGSGKLGQGFLLRAGLAGYEMILGTRNIPKGESIAEAFHSEYPSLKISTSNYLDAAKRAQVIIFSIPFMEYEGILTELREALSGKIVVVVGAPVKREEKRVSQVRHESLGEWSQHFLGETVKVVAAFHSIPAHQLSQPKRMIESHTLIFGNDTAACETILKLAEDMHIHGFLGGPIPHALALEAFTSILIFINRHYGVDGASIRIIHEESEK